jgi:hypothetical protein
LPAVQALRLGISEGDEGLKGRKKKDDDD